MTSGAGKTRFALSTKILLLAFGNLLLLALLLLLFARFQLHLEFNSFLFGARDRVVSMARELTLDLEDTPAQSRDELLQRYKQTYGVDFYLFANPLTQIGGPAIDLPAAVIDEIHKPPGRGKSSESGPPVFEISTGNPTLYWVGARIVIREAGVEGHRPGTLLMVSRSLLGTPLFFDFKPWLGVSGAVVVVFILCWVPFIRGITRTVSQMSRVTEQIAEGRFDQHLAEERRDELGALAASINQMASRLSGFVNGQRRFLGDIAHELCAPIARIQFAIAILEHRTDAGAVDDLRDEVRQMSGLVAELLSFSKEGMQPEARPPIAVNVAESIRQAVAMEGAQVEVGVDENLTAMADPQCLQRAISNLLRNAIRYAGDAGPVAIAASRDRGEVSIVVRDSGPGLPENEVDRVFTPFYRVETSRSRSSGGVGLGLAIVRNCVEACKGTVRCRNRAPSGLEVEIRLAAGSAESAARAAASGTE
jgi:two-component system, OmpR family, sensor histidine kinase CpxA